MLNMVQASYFVLVRATQWVKGHLYGKKIISKATARGLEVTASIASGIKLLLYENIAGVFSA